MYSDDESCDDATTDGVDNNPGSPEGTTPATVAPDA